MKLLTKTSFFYLAASLVVFLIAIVVMVFTVHYIVNDEVDERLLSTREEVIFKLNEVDSLPNALITIGDIVQLEPLEKYRDFTYFLSDTIIYNSYEKEMVPYHRLRFSAEIHGQPYSITLSKPHIEEEDIYEAVITAVVVLFIVLLLLLFILNRWVFTRTWRPFYKTLEEISNFSIEAPLRLPGSSIKEFHELEAILARMTDKMRKDFYNLKEFTENASHEIQTPLAIIKGKLELLMQSENLNKEQVEQIRAMSSATSRLSSLSRTLLLLSKIENRQFVEEELVEVKTLIEGKFERYEELIAIRKIKVVLELAEVNLKMNPTLSESLFTNLIYNSINHNLEEGKIHAVLNSRQFIISNTGPVPEKAPEEYFERFVKSGRSSSHGLGLALVKHICAYYGYGLSYRYEKEMHILTIVF